MRLLITIVASVLILTISHGQTVHKNLMQGDLMYTDSLYNQAEEHYRKAQNEGSTFKSIYNLGNALYKQERYEEASEQFNRAVSNATTKEDKALAMHNLANAYLYSQKLQDAILFYKEAIKLNPDHKETKYNLMVAKEIMKQAQPQEQNKECDNPQESEDGEQSEEEKENQEQQEQQQDQQENQEEQEEKEEESEEDSEDEQEDEEEDKDSESEEDQSAAMDSSRLEKQSLDSLDAMKLLQIIQDEEAKVQEKLRKFSTDRRKSDKDW